jgi:hypothetical protein
MRCYTTAVLDVVARHGPRLEGSRMSGTHALQRVPFVKSRLCWVGLSQVFGASASREEHFSVFL